jgi:cytochrome oxidase Cu insertion factor (SCO1/SenC/PrrC family)
VGRRLAGLLSLPLVVIVAGCTAAPRPQPSGPSGQDDHDVDWPVGDFSLTERSGRTVTCSDLRGKVWVASFLFTRCGSTCPRIADNLARLQDALRRYDDVRLVSFSVDPEHDTPAVLRRYADGHQADPERWLFLTGSEKEIYSLIRDSFHDHAARNRGTASAGGNEVLHSNRVFVVDRRGHIRWFCDGTIADSVGKLRDKVRELAREPS